MNAAPPTAANTEDNDHANNGPGNRSAIDLRRSLVDSVFA